MLITVGSLISASVKSLQLGREVAKVSGFLIDPRTLKIVAFYVSGTGIGFEPAVLMPEDVREIGPVGFIIDDADKIISPDDVVRFGEIIEFNFKLDNILVVDDKKRKLGRVDSYAIDPASCFIEQLYVRPPWTQSLRVAQMIIGRKQIKDISNDKIIVKAPTVKAKTTAKVLAKTSDDEEAYFENPFRKPETASDITERN